MFPKKLYWNIIFLVLSGKIFLFSKNMILFFRMKIKDDLSQKNTWKYDNFYIFGKDGISFSKNMTLPFSQKSKDDLLT